MSVVARSCASVQRLYVYSLLLNLTSTNAGTDLHGAGWAVGSQSTNGTTGSRRIPSRFHASQGIGPECREYPAPRARSTAKKYRGQAAII